MKYFEVMIASSATALDSSLTYCYDNELSLGQVVRVPLRGRELNGLVLKTVSKPKYKTKAITAVIKEVILPKQLLRLAEDVASYYGAPKSSCYGLLLPSGVHINRRNTPPEAPTPKPSKRALPALSTDQKQALAQILASDPKDTITLHGETGSGKTRVYLELAQTAQAKGLASIVLVPEIGLTTQLVQGS